MNIHIHTFGCRLNQYESEKISYELKNMGANITELNNADAVAINTCTVTNDSDKKLIAYLEKLGDISKKKVFLIQGTSFPQARSALSSVLGWALVPGNGGHILVL